MKAGRFFVMHLNETNLVLARAQGVHDSVNSVSGNTKDNLYASINQPLDKHFASTHATLLFCLFY
jgi:hypothetical protein